MENQNSVTLTLFNSLTRTLEAFAPLDGKTARIYTCGPTVYNRVHIGNLRTFVWEDVLCRTLRFLGCPVVQVMNLTDIDDKTIRGAVAEGVTLSEFTAKHAASFFEDLKTLNVIPATHYPRATGHIPEMVDLVKRLTARGHTYESDGSIWFRISSFESYGRLARIDPSAAVRGARVADDEYEKEDLRDFALWKSWKEGEPESATWTTELGKGRPGWHIECSAMSMKYLGESFDIHTGAVDNIFPHHENEIAQSEAATGVPFVRFWLHAEHLLVDGEKMAKSKGNFYTLPDLLARGFSPRAIRYLFLSVPYRQKLNFTLDSLGGAEAAVARLLSLETRLRERAAGSSAQDPEPALTSRLEVFQKDFRSGLEDDINTAAALGAVFTLAKEINPALETGQVSPAGAAATLEALHAADAVLGVLPAAEAAGMLESEILEKIEARQDARKRRDFAAADAVRKELAERGILLEDTPQGVRWRRKP